MWIPLVISQHLLICAQGLHQNPELIYGLRLALVGVDTQPHTFVPAGPARPWKFEDTLKM